MVMFLSFICVLRRVGIRLDSAFEGMCITLLKVSYVLSFAL